MKPNIHNLIEPDSLYVDRATPADKDRRSPRAAKFRATLAELQRERAHSMFLVVVCALAILALAWSHTSLRDELTDARAEIVVMSATLAAKNVVERQWDCREHKIYKNVRTCIRTVSRM